LFSMLSYAFSAAASSDVALFSLLSVAITLSLSLYAISRHYFAITPFRCRFLSSDFANIISLSPPFRWPADYYADFQLW
jgi:hypothetical protein